MNVTYCDLHVHGSLRLATSGKPSDIAQIDISRILRIDLNTGGNYLVMVDDPSDPTLDDNEPDRTGELMVEDPADMAALLRLIAVLASPAAFPPRVPSQDRSSHPERNPDAH